MVVRARAERDRPGVPRLEVVALDQLRDVGRGDRGGEPYGELVLFARAGAVPPLPDPEQEHQPLDVVRLIAGPIRYRGCARAWPAAARTKARPARDRPAVGLQVAVVLLGQVPDEDVQRDVALRQPGRDLHRQERPREVGDAQRALDRVVVGDRDQVHAAGPADPVEAFGVGVGLAQAGPAQRVVPAVGGVGRVAVQVTAKRPRHGPPSLSARGSSAVSRSST